MLSAVAGGAKKQQTKVLGMVVSMVEDVITPGGASLTCLGIHSSNIAGWKEERSGPTGKSFRFVRACVRAVIVKWK